MINNNSERKIPNIGDVYTFYDKDVNYELAMNSLRRIITVAQDASEDTTMNGIKYFGVANETAANESSVDLNGQIAPTGTLAVNTSEHAKDRWPFVVTFEKPQ